MTPGAGGTKGKGGAVAVGGATPAPDGKDGDSKERFEVKP